MEDNLCYIMSDYIYIYIHVYIYIHRARQVNECVSEI